MQSGAGNRELHQSEGEPMSNAILENREQLIGMREAAKSNSVNPATVTRWIQTGSKGKNGTRIFLIGVRRGSKWLTSEAAIRRFFEELTANSLAPVEGVTETTRERGKASEAATRELESLLA
jgi:hypothetical protein